MVRKVSLAFTIHHGPWLKAFIAVALKTPNNIGACTVSTWIADWTFISIWKRRMRQCYKVWRSFHFIGACVWISTWHRTFPGHRRAPRTLAPYSVLAVWLLCCAEDPKGSSVQCSEPTDRRACPKNHKPKEECGLLLPEQGWKVIK